jgi:hypothetical protein
MPCTATPRAASGSATRPVPAANSSAGRPATTALLGRKNYQGFSSYWPAVAEDDEADPRDRSFAQRLNAVETIVFSRILPHAS